MRLVHFSSKPIHTVYSTYGQRADYKPNGFWVSDEDDHGSTTWSDFCKDADMRLDTLRQPTEVELAPNHNVLILRSANELDLFTEKYGTDPDKYQSRLGEKVDWPRVAETWHGIIITPYIWSRRLADHCFWYYGWDCASGCIWDASAIAALKILPASMFDHYTGSVEATA